MPSVKPTQPAPHFRGKELDKTKEAKKFTKELEFSERIALTANIIRNFSITPTLLSPRKDGTTAFTDVVDTVEYIGPLVIFPLIGASLYTFATVTFFTLPCLVVAGAVKLFAVGCSVFDNKNDKGPLHPFFPIKKQVRSEKEMVKMILDVITDKATLKEKKAVEKFFDQKRLDHNKEKGWISEEFHSLMSEFISVYKEALTDAKNSYHSIGNALYSEHKTLLARHDELATEFESYRTLNDRANMDKTNNQIVEITNNIKLVTEKIIKINETNSRSIEDKISDKIKPLVKNYIETQRRYYDAEIERKIDKKLIKKMKMGEDNKGLEEAVIADKKVKLRDKISGPVKRTSQKADLLNEALQRREATTTPYNIPLPFEQVFSKSFIDEARTLFDIKIKGLQDITKLQEDLSQLSHVYYLLNEVEKNARGEESLFLSLLNTDRLNYNLKEGTINQEFYDVAIRFKKLYDLLLEKTKTEIEHYAKESIFNPNIKFLIQKLQDDLKVELTEFIRFYPAKKDELQARRYMENISMNYIKDKINPS